MYTLVFLLQFFFHISSVNIINFKKILVSKLKELLLSCTVNTKRKILDFPAILMSTQFTETLKISISIKI